MCRCMGGKEKGPEKREGKQDAGAPRTFKAREKVSRLGESKGALTLRARRCLLALEVPEFFNEIDGGKIDDFLRSDHLVPAIPELVKLLGDIDIDTRINAAWAIRRAECKDKAERFKDAVPLLTRMLGGITAFAATLALRDIGDEEAFSALEKAAGRARSNEDWDVFEEISKTMESIEKRLEARKDD